MSSVSLSLETESLNQREREACMQQPAHPLNTSNELVCFDRTLQELLPRSAAGGPRDRVIVLHVNTVCPTEVKIVPSSILPQQSQRWLGQKQYLDMAADVPKQAQEDRPASVTFGITRNPGRVEKLETMWFMGTLEGERKSQLVCELETLNRRL